ncbi:MAG: TRAP transporter large permease, partial [Rhodospirillales bacterium]
LLMLRVPMLVSVAGAAFLNFYLSGAWALTMPQTIMSGLGRFVLIALPLFVLAGGLMNAGGISGRLFEFARAIVGSMRGGLAHVNVVTSMFFGGMIGSSTADLAGTGSIVIPAMKKNNYPADFAAALTASSSGIGPMIPPSSPMILYSAITGVSLGALFLAGIIPGLLLALSQMLIVAYLARKRGWLPYAAFSLHEVWRTGKRAILPFGLPLIIVGGMVVGLFTPSEAGAFAVVYALFLSMVVHRALTLRGLY